MTLQNLMFSSKNVISYSKQLSVVLKLQSKIWPNSLPTSYKTEPAQTTHKTILLKTTVKTVFKKIVWTGSGLQDFYSCAQISCTEHDNQPGSLQLGSENLQRIRATWPLWGSCGEHLKKWSLYRQHCQYLTQNLYKWWIRVNSAVYVRVLKWSQEFY